MTVIYKLILSFLMVAAWYASSIQNNEDAVSLQYLKNTLSYEVEFCMRIDMEIFYNLTVLFLMGLARHAQSTQVNLQYLCDILKEVRNAVRDLTSYNVLPSLTLFFCQCGSHTKPFLYMFNYLCNISSLSFHVMVGPCKLA